MGFLAKIAVAALQQTEAEKASADKARAGELVAAARERLHQVLGDDADPDVLAVDHVSPETGVVVLSDGSVQLAVDEGGLVSWVTKVDGQWEAKASVDSLATLGAALIEAGVA